MYLSLNTCKIDQNSHNSCKITTHIIMNSDIEQAINAEKAFNNKNNLLITFHNPELNENSFKKLHRNIQNVHILEPEFIPKIRYILELKDLTEADTIKHTILRSQTQYNKGFITINLLDNYVQSYKNIDPYKLDIKNLPVNITDREIKQLYPLSTQYHFIRSDSRNSKSILAHFTNIKDAISAYKITNKILFRSNHLKVQFYRDKTKSEDSHEDHTDSEDDISKWEKIEEDCLKNKKVSDTLLIKNFPLDTTGTEILKLYPQCKEYKFVFDNLKTKDALVKFSKIEDAVKMYTESNNIFKSNILHFEFYFYDKNKKKRKRAKLKQEKYEDNQQSSSNLTHFETKLNEEGINIKTVDSSVLHIDNLPFSTTNEDLLELFPDHQQYQLIPDELSSTSSAYICFNTPFEALQAFKSTKNKLYKRKMLSIKFKSKTLKINPFALKRKTNDENNEKQMKISTNEDEDNDDVVVIEEMSNPKMINEDEIECKSEDENYEDDIYAGLDLEIDDLDHEDISDDNDFQGIELDDDVLPLDEDDF